LGCARRALLKAIEWLYSLEALVPSLFDLPREARLN